MKKRFKCYHVHIWSVLGCEGEQITKAKCLLYLVGDAEIFVWEGIEKMATTKCCQNMKNA